MINQSIKSRTQSGIFWKSIDTFAVQVIRFILSIILARLLSSTDYGLIGMLAIFFVMSDLFADSGLSIALVQKQDRTKEDFHTYFFFNLGVSLFLYTILFFCAPLISDFYDQPLLTPIIRIMFLSTIVTSFTAVQHIQFLINIDFKPLAIASIISVSIGGVIGIIAAYFDYKVWSLVIQGIVSALLQASLLFYFGHWKPKLTFKVESFKKLYNFGAKVLTVGVISNVFSNLYSILIGKFYSASDVGFFTRARGYPELLTNTTSTILHGVTLPIFASLQQEKEKMIELYQKILRLSVYIIMPALSLLAILAEPLVRIILTVKWLPIVPIMQWICVAKIISSISGFNSNLLNANGRSDLYMKIEFIKLPISILTLLISLQFGIQAVAVGLACSSLICFPINSYYSGKLFGFGPLKQLFAVRKIIFFNFLSMILVFGLTTYLEGDIIKLIAGIGGGIVIYYALTKAFKLEEILEIEKIVRASIQKMLKNTA